MMADPLQIKKHVKTIIAGVLYDTDTAKRLAHKPTCSSDQQLFQTADGKFFLFIIQLYVDGKQLGPSEVWLDMGPHKPRKNRLCMTARIEPLSEREALEWSIKTQIPTPFRGYILESI